jgi:DNA-binding Xre family transcriptional regulator
LTPNRSHQHCSTENPIRNKPIDYIEAPNYYEGMKTMRKPSRTLAIIRERIVHEMQERNLSQREFAEAIGISRVWLTNFLNGKVALSFADAEAIADFLDIELADLISEKICR